MKFMKTLLALVLTFAFAARADELETIFQSPPPAARPHVMWMWMGCNLSKPEITKDLEALRDVGFGGMLLFSVADTTTPWPGEIGNTNSRYKFSIGARTFVNEWNSHGSAYHEYLSRCQCLLQRGVTVADVCFLAAEGAPHVFRPPSSATSGNPPDHGGYNFDGCAPETLLERGQG